MKTEYVILKFTKGANWEIYKHSKGDKSCKCAHKVDMKKTDIEVSKND